MLNLRVAIKVLKLYLGWFILTCKIKYKKIDVKQNHLLIIPCDPWTGIGSRGDEAMMLSTIQYFRKKNPKVKISMVLAPDKRNESINFQGVSIYYYWKGNVVKNVCNLLCSLRPNNLVVLGADCMDGFYSPIVSLNLLVICDLSIKISVSTTLLGFSFNSTPSKYLYLAFRLCTSKLKFHLRDVVSKERFERFTKRKALLVADVAFLMEPDRFYLPDSSLLDWINSRKDNHEMIVGINFHPMLLNSTSKDSINAFSVQIAKKMCDLLDLYPNLHYLLIPHDNRENISDLVCLSILANYLKEVGKENRFYFLKNVLHAPEIKQICIYLDALITSRMHLAIAALGVKVPVMAIAYQGKFPGLFKSFELNLSYLLTPEQFVDLSIISTLRNFINERETIANSIDVHLLDVRKKALINFE